MTGNAAKQLIGSVAPAAAILSGTFLSGSIEEAVFRAMGDCVGRGPCHIETTFLNRRLALALQGPGYDGFGRATRATLRSVRGAALNTGQSDGNFCEICESPCDTAGR